MKEIDCREAARLLAGWDRVLILCHASPDGDTLGSAAALVRGLQALGKHAWVRCGDPVPEKYRFLFAGIPEEPEAFQHVVSVDVADPKLLGELEEPFARRTELAIDHHGTHVPFAQVRWVEPTSAACCELIFLLLEELGVEITGEMAGCLYTGIATDTGCFRFANTTPRTHFLAGRLMELGASAEALNRRLFETKTRAQVEAERRVLAELEVFGEGRCALARLPWSLRQETGAEEGDLEGIAGLPRQIEGVVLGITLKEKENGDVKVSVRANPPADAAAFCRQFGGGGHTGAAGCTFLQTPMETVAGQLRAAAEAYVRAVTGA